MRRLKVLTHGADQVRMASMFLLWFVVFAVGLIAIFFFRYTELSIQTEDLNMHDSLVTKMLLIDQARDLALWYGGATLLFCIMLWTYMLVYTHRMTGPVYKLEKILERCAHNKEFPSSPLTFRKTDAFHNLAKEFNHFVDSLNAEARSSQTSAEGEKKSPQ